jgi:hypothetical protein
LETAKVLYESASRAIGEGRLEGAQRRLASAGEELAFALGVLDGKEPGEPDGDVELQRMGG